MCDRPRDHWGLFILSWLGSEEAEKVRRSHVVDPVAKYDTFRDGLIALFGRFEFEASYRASLRNLRQAGAESIATYAARTTDMCSRAYANFSTEDQLSLAVDHFIAGLADQSSRAYLQRERAQRALEWLEVCESHRRAKPRVFLTTCQLPRPLRAKRIIRLRQPPRVSSQIPVNKSDNCTRRTTKRTRACVTSTSNARKSIRNRNPLPYSSLSNQIKLLLLAIPLRIPVLLK